MIMNNSAILQIKNFLYRFFHYIFITVFSLVFIIIITKKETLTDKFLLMILTLLSLLFIFLLYKLIVRSKIPVDKWDYKHLILLFVIFAILQVIIGGILRVNPSWDFGYVYDEAVQLTKNNTWTISNQSYFLMYPNNQFYLLILTLIYKFLAIFDIAHYLIVGLLTNIVFIDISLLILFFCLKKIWNQKIAYFGLLLSFLCSTYIAYIPIFYTDTFPLPLMNIMILLYIIILKEKNWKKCFVYCTLLSFSCMLAFELKATAIIVLIAIILHVIFSLRVKKVLLCVITLVSMFFVSLKLYDVTFENLHMLDMTQYERYNFPYTHWIMMGLKTPGGFNQNDYNYTKSFKTKDQKTEVNLKVISERLSAMGVGGFVEHLSEKINYTWNDGTYFSSKLLARKPLTNGIVRDYYSIDGQYNSFYQWTSDGLHYAIIILMIVSAFHGLSKNNKNRTFDFISCLRLAIFGLFLFLLIWESKSKYLVNFIPIMYIIAIDGVNYIFKLIARREIHDEVSDCSTLL